MSSEAPTYFISDLHLDASRKAVSLAFRHFLNKTAKGARAIYILGDFVDAWVGDDDDSSYARELKADLRKRVSAGTSIYFMAGNRDFLIGKRFADDTGVKLLTDPSVVTLYGNKVLLLHGDSLCTDDLDYQKFRRKVRDPKWQKRVLRYPLFLRRFLAARMRSRSMRANATKAEAIMDVSAEAVMQAFQKHKVNVMIHGHTHRPAHHVLDQDGKRFERYVLGDWEAKGWYLRADDSGLRLQDFAITS